MLAAIAAVIVVVVTTLGLATHTGAVHASALRLRWCVSRLVPDRLCPQPVRARPWRHPRLLVDDEHLSGRVGTFGTLTIIHGFVSAVSTSDPDGGPTDRT
ncbi:MAG TPA: hypothetical protein VGK50_01765 [Coriobacteriia bacterium]|jgi:low temperature requirement protein LtrA